MQYVKHALQHPTAASGVVAAQLIRQMPSIGYLIEEHYMSMTTGMTREQSLQ